MKNFNFKNILPHAVAVVLFLLIAVVYCLPVFQGMVVSQHDMLGTRGMTQQSIGFFEKYLVETNVRPAIVTEPVSRIANGGASVTFSWGCKVLSATCRAARHR